MDMFLDLFDEDGVMREPAGPGRGAFVSREDVAQTAAAALTAPPGGILTVTGPEAVSLTEVAQRLSVLTGRTLHYEDEAREATQLRLSREPLEAWRVDLSVGWFESIASGEIKRMTDTVFGYTGRRPLGLAEYFAAFPHLLQSMQLQT